MKKPHMTFTVQPETPAALRTLAQTMGILHTRGPGAGKEGSASSLLDYIAGLVQTEGADAIARRLKGDG